MKKIIALVGAGVMLLSVAVPVLALDGLFHKDVAIVKNSAIATADTGLNDQGNGVTVKKAGVDNITVSGTNSMTTGTATAYAGALVVANTHIGCGACGDGALFSKDIAVVKNRAIAEAYTGWNSQGNGVSVKKAHADNITVSGNNSMTTGTAWSKARAWVVVNTHVSGL